MDPDCLFCKIATRQIPTKVVYEDDATMAFLEIMPRAPGHTMVIAKQHAPTLLELSDADRTALFTSVKKVDALLIERLNPDGMTIGINQGGASGQEIQHLHVHLMPRWYDDKGGSIQSIVSLTDKNKQKEAEKRLLGII